MVNSTALADLPLATALRTRFGDAMAAARTDAACWPGAFCTLGWDGRTG
jgi:hypothetical protein